MARYLIKATYETGRHKGTSYLLRKGGFVTDEGQYQWEHTTYKTKGIAERECRRLAEQSKWEYEDERKWNEYNIRRGNKGKEWFIHEIESYEPWEVPQEVMV